MIPSRRYYVSLVLFLVWLASVALTWRVVENPYWDFADLLYSAERLSLGQMIYRDFQTPYPPLVFWLYGGAMKIFPHSYAAGSAISGLSALFFLLGSYRLGRLFFARLESALLAVSIYLAVFVISSTIGENFIALGFPFVGITLFTWFAWFAAKYLRENHPGAWVGLGAGVLAGLCLLSKHERAAGVGGVLAFLFIVFIFWRRHASYLLSLSILLLGMLAVAGSGYFYATVYSGWFYVAAALAQYGIIKSSAAQNNPDLADLSTQAMLLAFYFVLIMVMAFRQTRLNVLKYIFWGLAIGLGVLALEGARVIAVAEQLDFNSARPMSRMALAVAFFSPHGLQLPQSVLNYFGGLFFNNIMPLFITLILLSACLAGRYVRRIRPGQPSFKWLLSGLLLVAALGLQARFLLRRSEIGALALLLPVFFRYAPRLPFMILGRPTPPALLRSIRQRLISVFLVLMFLASALVYAYEFRDVLIRPLWVQTDKGLIRLPDLPMNRAFAQLVAYLRQQRFAGPVVAVPQSGIQYWIGGGLTPFAWGGPIQAESFRPPWSDNLKSGLVQENNVFVEFCRQEVNIQSIVSERRISFINGPSYRLERWKELFPMIWNHIQSNTMPVAAFGPTNAPYFRVYVDKKAEASRKPAE